MSSLKELEADLARMQQQPFSLEPTDAEAEVVTRVENYLLQRLVAKGPDDLRTLLTSLSQFGFQSANPEQTRFESQDSSPPLVVMFEANEDFQSIYVTVLHDEETIPLSPEYRAFYDIWERVMGQEELPSKGVDRQVAVVAQFEADLMNGGFGQYLVNTEGEYVPELLKLLKKFGASKTEALLMQADHFAKTSVSYAHVWADCSEQLQQLDDLFLTSGEDLAALAAVSLGLVQTS